MSTETTVLGQLYAIGTTAGHRPRPHRAERSAAHLAGARPGRRRAHGPARRLGRRRRARRSTGCASRPSRQRGIALGGRGQGFGQVGHADIGTLNDVVARGRSRSRTPSAVADADAIAALPGADVLFVGPADLSHALGVPGRFDDPVYLAAITDGARGLRAARQGGRHPALRSRGDRATPRARLPVHRSGFGRRVRDERRQGDARGRRSRLRPGRRSAPPRSAPRGSVRGLGAQSPGDSYAGADAGPAFASSPVDYRQANRPVGVVPGAPLAEYQSPDD